MSGATRIGVEAVVKRYDSVYSRWTIYDYARRGLIPHRKPPGTRQLVFIDSELDEWEDGCELEVIQLRDGGRVVRPVNGDGR